MSPSPSSHCMNHHTCVQGKVNAVSQFLDEFSILKYCRIRTLFSVKSCTSCYSVLACDYSTILLELCLKYTQCDKHTSWLALTADADFPLPNSFGVVSCSALLILIVCLRNEKWRDEGNNIFAGGTSDSFWEGQGIGITKLLLFMISAANPSWLG